MIKAFFEPEDITQSFPVSSLDDELRPGEKSFSKRFILILGSLAHKPTINVHPFYLITPTANICLWNRTCKPFPSSSFNTPKFSLSFFALFQLGFPISTISYLQFLSFSPNLLCIIAFNTHKSNSPSSSSSLLLFLHSLEGCFSCTHVSSLRLFW